MAEKKEKRYVSDNAQLMAEWDWEKNQGLDPTHLTLGSNKKAWWKLPYDDPNTGKHFVFEWQAAINNRQERGCPYLSKPAKAIQIGFNDLATTHPELLAEWDYDKNTILPTEISAGCNQKAWWKCKNGHNWEAIIASRSKGVQCPFCQNVRVLVGYNDVLTKFPDVASEWDYNKNTLRPETVLFSSPSLVWWKCSKCGNEWKTSVRHRTTRHQNCPKCSSELKTSFGEQAIYFYLSKIFSNVSNRYLFDNKRELDIYIPEICTGIEYDGVYYHQNRKIQDQEKEDTLKAHGIILYRVIEQQCKTSILTKGNTITFCNRNKGELDLAILELFRLMNIQPIEVDTEKDYSQICESYLSITKANSVSSSNLINEWNYEKNMGVNPDFISLGSTKKVWWKCCEGHEWQATVGSRNSGRSCPVCSGKRVVTGINDLVTTNPELLLEWDYTKNTVTPEEVAAGSARRVWWKCKNCAYSWETRILGRAVKGHGCPKCSVPIRGKQKVLKLIEEKGSLVETHPHLINEWNYSKNIDISPHETHAGSHRKVWWICSKCACEWEIEVRNRAKLGRGCPQCRKNRGTQK